MVETAAETAGAMRDDRPSFTSRELAWPGLLVEGRDQPPGGARVPPLPAHLLVVNSARPNFVALHPAGADAEYRWEAPHESVHLYLSSVDLGERTGATLLRPLELGDARLLDAPRLGEIGMALADEVRRGGTRGRLYADGLRAALIRQIVVGVAGAHHAGRDAPLGPRKLGIVLDRIEAGLTENLAVTDLAREVGLSEFHLMRAFRLSTGTTIHAHVVRRVEQATARLRVEPFRTIGQIAQEVGFYDEAHLARHFRRLLGVPPGAYRRHAR